MSEGQYGNDRPMTPEEKRWCKRLLRCLNDMPRGIEIEVFYTGTIDVRVEGTRAEYVNENGDADAVPCLECLIPKTKDRIDGADHVI